VRSEPLRQAMPTRSLAPLAASRVHQRFTRTASAIN
jgi:hypothetical protein